MRIDRPRISFTNFVMVATNMLREMRHVSSTNLCTTLMTIGLIKNDYIMIEMVLEDVLHVRKSGDEYTWTEASDQKLDELKIWF